MRIAIIDAGSGNLHSVEKAFAHAASSHDHVTLTRNPADLQTATHIVLPGVGAFADVRVGVEAIPGMREALEEEVIQARKPFLGICVGMQLMADWGREHGNTQGFGWIGGEVVPIEPGEPPRPIPHMGWNTLTLSQPDHPLLKNIPQDASVYFVHSYHMRCREPAHCLAHTEYGHPIAAIVGRDNLVGTQFHPEKSQHIGLTLIGNFLQWMG